MSQKFTVELEGTTGFVLDTDRLNTGQLGYLSVDITEYVRSISIKRGRSISQDKFTAGQATLTLDNRSRIFDPQNASSPLFGAIVPRRKVNIYMEHRRTIMGVPQATPRLMFIGVIDDWSFSYDISGDSIATVSCSDGFNVLANQIITLTSPTAELSSSRITRVLNNSQVGWTEGFVTNGAAITCNNASYTGDALSYLQQIALSERGYLFIGTYGEIQFFGWNYFASPIEYQRFSDGSDGKSGMPFTNIEVTYGADQLYNYVTVVSPAGTVVSQDTLSQQEYGISAVDYQVLTSGTAQMQLMADVMTSNYAEPRYLVSSLTVSGDDPYFDETNSGLLTEIGNYASVFFTPNLVGSSISTSGYIIGVDISATPSSSQFTYSFSGVETRSVI
jgi:hypothetical protein